MPMCSSPRSRPSDGAEPEGGAEFGVEVLQVLARGGRGGPAPGDRLGGEPGQVAEHRVFASPAALTSDLAPRQAGFWTYFVYAYHLKLPAYGVRPMGPVSIIRCGGIWMAAPETLSLRLSYELAHVVDRAEFCELPARMLAHCCRPTRSGGWAHTCERDRSRSTARATPAGQRLLRRCGAPVVRWSLVLRRRTSPSDRM